MQVTSTVATITVTRDITMQKGHNGKLGTRGTFAWSNKRNFSEADSVEELGVICFTFPGK